MKALILILILATTSCNEPLTQTVQSPVHPLSVPQPPNSITPYIKNVINRINAPLPAYYKEVLVRLLGDIATDSIKDPDLGRIWIAMIAVESRFERSAKSNRGARGIGQLLPAYKDDFGKVCGFDNVRPDDLWDIYINAQLSACYFKDLVARNEGSIPFALIAYNAGPNSESLKAAKQGRSINNEPANYVTKIMIVKEQGERND